MVVTLKSAWAGAYEVKHTIPTQLSSPTPRYLPKRSGNLRSHKNLHVNAYRNVIHGS